MARYKVKIKISKKELERIKKEIIEERRRFIELYVKWLKSTKKEKWLKQQKKLIDSVFKKLKKLG